MSAVLLVAALRVGHAGGQLAYRDGAAQAHVSAARSPGSLAVDAERNPATGDDDDD